MCIYLNYKFEYHVQAILLSQSYISLIHVDLKIG